MKVLFFTARILRYLVMIMLASVGSVSAQNQWIACSLPLAPQTMPGAKREATGLASDVLFAVAKSLDWQIEVRYMPWLRVVHEAKAGRCDIVYTVLHRQDYEQIFLFPQEPVLDQTNVLIVRKNSGITFDGDLEQFMRKYRIGMYQDKALDNKFEQMRSQPWANIQVSVDANQNLQMLMRGRIDAVIENDMTAIYELRKLGKLALVDVLSPALNTVPAYIVFPIKGRLGVKVAAFDTAVADFKKTSDYNRLINHYLGKD